MTSHRQNKKETKMNLFDLKNTTDLPEGLGLTPVKYEPSEFERNVTALLLVADGQPVTIDEITAAYYRMYGVIIHRNKMRDKLWQCSQHPECKFEKVPHKKHDYRIKKDKDNGPIKTELYG